MRVVITGGSGLIGRAVAAPLAARGDEVVVLSRDPGRVRGLPPGVRAAAWDGRSATGWEALVDRQTAILNLAGEGVAEGRWTAERKRRIRDSRLDTGRAVVAAVRQAAAEERAPRVVVQASAVGYYGDGGDRELTEESPPGSGFLADVCVEWEKTTAEIETLGVRRVLLRTGIVLSRDGGALAKMLPPFRLGVGGPLGGGRQWLPWIHLADEVGAILFLLDAAAATPGGPFNFTAPNPVTNKDFGAALGAALHRPAVMPVPGIALHLLFGEMAKTILEGQRALPAALLAAGYRFRFPLLGPALADLLSEPAA
jgi:uncharacterized protein (TIGR01777 family)